MIRRRLSPIALLLALLVLLLIPGDSPAVRADRARPPAAPRMPAGALPQGGGVDVGWSCCTATEIARLQPAWWVNYWGIQTPIDGPGHVYMAWHDHAPAALGAWAATHPGHVWMLGNVSNVPGQDACGTPAHCGAIWRAQMAAIRAGDPSAVFLGPGLGDASVAYAQQLVDAGADVFQAWVVHYYPPQSDPYNAAHLVAAVQTFQAWLARRGDTRPLILGEFGVPPTAHDGAGAQHYMQASVAWLRTSGVRAWAWFSVRSAGRWSGDLLDAGGSLTPLGVTWLDILAPARRTPESRR